MLFFVFKNYKYTCYIIGRKALIGVRYEIAVKSTEDLLRDTVIVGSVAIVLSIYDDRFLEQYASVAIYIRNNPTKIFIAHV